MTQSSKTVLSTIGLALMAVAWGTSYAVMKDTLDAVHPFTLMFFRFGLSTLALSVLYGYRIKKITMVDLKRGACIGLFLFLSFLTLVLGMQTTTASKLSFIVGAYVLVVPFLAWFFSRRVPDRYAVLAALMATGGLALLTLDKGFQISLGDVLCLACAVFFAAHMVAIEHFGKDSDPILLTIIQFGVTAGLFGLLVLWSGNMDASVIFKAKGSLVYLVLICTVIPFAMQNVVQKFLSSTRTAVILTLQSVFGSIFATYYLKETMTWPMVAGCAIIFIAILLQETKFQIFPHSGL